MCVVKENGYACTVLHSRLVRAHCTGPREAVLACPREACAAVLAQSSLCELVAWRNIPLLDAMLGVLAQSNCSLLYFDIVS